MSRSGTGSKGSKRAFAVASSVFVAAGTAAVAPVAPARAAAPRGLATVVSVDGPLRLTVRVKGRTAAVLLSGLDAPRAATGAAPAECGAAESTALLGRLMPRGLKLRLSLDPQGRKVEGRTLVIERPTGRAGGRALRTTRLRLAGGARMGAAAAPDSTAIPVEVDQLSVDLSKAAGYTQYGPEEAASRRRAGVWGACGGRFHAPVTGAPVPYPASAAWALGPDGITTAIGPLALSTDLRPSTATRFANLRAAYPDAEFVRGVQGRCTAWSAAGGFVADGIEGDQAHSNDPERRPCDQEAVLQVASTGAANPTTSGPRVGDPLAVFTAAFPSAARNIDGFPALRLAPGESAPWAWATIASYARGRVTQLTTSLVLPDDGS